MTDSLEPQDEDVLLNIHRQEMTRQTNAIPVKYAQNFVRVYGSQTMTSSTPWDISFSIAQPIADNPHDIHMEQRVLVTMSWQAVKALAQMLLQRVNTHEQQYGEIRIIPLPQQSEQPTSE